MSSLSAVTVLVYEGFEPLDAIGPYEVFSIAAGQGPGFDVSLRTVEPADRVEAAFGLTVEPDGTLAESDADLVVVPGGGWNNEAAAGARAEAERGTVPDALTDRSAAGDTSASVLVACCSPARVSSTADRRSHTPARWTTSARPKRTSSTPAWSTRDRW
jgi:putative intracellular protease/amidase